MLEILRMGLLQDRMSLIDQGENITNGKSLFISPHIFVLYSLTLSTRKHGRQDLF